MNQVNFSIEDVNDSTSFVMKWLRERANYANSHKDEHDNANETSIEELIKDDNNSTATFDDDGVIGHVFSTGFKKNGMIDVALKYPSGTTKIFRNCVAQSTPLDEIVSSELSLKFNYDANNG